MDLNKKLEKLKPYQLNCNVFDVYSYNGLSMQDLLCQFFTKINECITVSNETIDLAKWLVNEGLEIEVVKKLMIWLEDGTLENIINVNLFNTLNEKINGLSSQLEHNQKQLISGKLPIGEKLKGASIYLPIPNGQPSIDVILEKMVYSNCNSITICPVFWMNSSTSNVIEGFKSGMTIQQIKEIFVKAKEKGLKTIVKPHVGGEGFTSWSSIKPTNVPLWITNYSNFYNSMVDDLVEYIDVFCISNELKGQTNNFKNLWVNLINSLKAKKNIPVISAITISESTTNIFLDKLDYIGFNMYCPVEGDMSTDINQQTKSIFRLKPYINDMFNVMSKYNKKAIITEVGILPFEVSLQNPEMWGFDIEPPTNYQVQQRYYNIAVKEFLYANNVVGVMVWNACDGFTFINRPVQETLKEIYGGVK